MKTIEISLFKFSELSGPAQQKAIDKWRNDEQNYQPFYIDDANNSFEEFAKLFNIKWRSIDYQETYRNDYSFSNVDDNVRQLSGQRLATWLWNNHKTDLFKGKIYWTNGYHKKRVSRIIIDEPYNHCVLTGVCYDNDVLGPIYDFMNKPTNDDFEDLINDCIHSLCKSVSDEIDYNNSDEAITENLIANDYDFTEEGEMY
jgi:hypothetical protein